MSRDHQGARTRAAIRAVPSRKTDRRPRRPDAPFTQEGANMLVLSRQRDETIMIGDDIEVTVVDIRGDKVRLGITAPKEISVHRKEVYDAIRRENREAARVKPEDLSGLGKIGPKSPKEDDKKHP
jgi:carbon storage regulator